MAPQCRPLVDRLVERIDTNGECWEWRGPRFRAGYGAISLGGRSGAALLTHRVAWEQFVGPIEDGDTIDHLCMNRGCVNPDHMELVPNAENARRGAMNRWHGQSFWPDVEG